MAMWNNPIIWFKNAALLLKDKFFFKNNISVEYSNSETLPNEVGQEIDGNEGSIILHTEGTVFVKQDNGATNNWNPIGSGGGGGAGGELLNLIVLDESGTYTKNADASYIIVECVGGGGAGGSAAAGTAASEGGGGGGGEYTVKLIQNSTVGATETVTIGAGGAGGTGSGGNGGSTSFGSHLEAVGGTGGSAMVTNGNNSVVAGGDGGTGGTGSDFDVPGGDGGTGRYSSSRPALITFGGQSFLSGNTPTSIRNTALDGIGYGAGGCGANNQGTQSTRNGGNGFKGVVRIWEYS
jgi:hypothetical protein